jgi:hypothetical protein
MRRLAAVVTTVVLLVIGLPQTPVAATTTWDFSDVAFTLSDGFGSTTTVTVQRMRVTGSAASGYVRVNDAAVRYACYTQVFNGLTAEWSNGAFSPCLGSVTFSVDSKGVLTLVGSGLVAEGILFTGAGSGSGQGVAQKPVVVPLQNCTAVTNTTAKRIDFAWTDNADATDYRLVVSSLPTVSRTFGPGGSGYVDFSDLKPGTAYRATLTARRADGETVATCTTNDAWTPPAAPMVNSTVPVTAGGLLTVNYSLPDPTGIQGIEYRIDGGPWLRPGGVAPVSGVGGSFTVSGLVARAHTLALRSVGEDLGGPLTTEASPPTSVSFPTVPATLPTSPGAVVGSSGGATVAAPPVNPASGVPGTSNGTSSGSGSSGALAAGTGDAGIDAPCLAKDGTLYPNQYSTVGSQLTMAPNTRGMGRAKDFTVVGGALAPGMQLDRSSGVLFGITTQAGSYMTAVKARFADGSARTSQFTTRVDADPETLQYAARNVGVVGKPTEIAPTTNAPSRGTTYRLVCGELPKGTRFDEATGRITGSPTSPVLMPTPLRVAETSSSGRSAASFIFVVTRTGESSFNYPAHPHVRVGRQVFIRPTVSGPNDFVTYRTAKGKLPRGLRLDPKTGAITGRVARTSRPHTITIVAVTTEGALVSSAPTKISFGRKSRSSR